MGSRSGLVGDARECVPARCHEWRPIQGVECTSQPLAPANFAPIACRQLHCAPCTERLFRPGSVAGAPSPIVDRLALGCCAPVHRLDLGLFRQSKKIHSRAKAAGGRETTVGREGQSSRITHVGVPMQFRASGQVAQMHAMIFVIGQQPAAVLAQGYGPGVSFPIFAKVKRSQLPATACIPDA